MAEAYDLLRAKSRRDEQTEDTNLLLKEHIISTIQRLIALNDYAEKNKESFSNNWFIDDEKRNDLFSQLTKAIFIHDLGKIESNFQKKLFNQQNEGDKKDWEEIKEIFGWKGYLGNSIKRHEYVSLFWSYFLLDDNEEAGKIRTAILFHHYNQFYTNTEKEFLEIIRNNNAATKNYLQFLASNKDKLEQFLDKLLTEIERRFSNNNFILKATQGLKSRINLGDSTTLKRKIDNQEADIYMEMFDPEEGNKEEQELFLFMSGILKRCDHSASAEIKIEEVIEIQKVFEEIQDRVNQKINSMKNSVCWQQQILEKGIKRYPLLIAPTGSGKTEFALLWAAKQNRKLIYTLPLRVALNDLFTRFKTYAGKELDKNKEIDIKNTVSLLHSTAFIEYIQEEQRGKEINIDQKIQSARNYAAPIILTTPDQVFLTALNFYGSDKLKSIFPFSSIIIDEIQAYDPEMAAVIIRSIGNIQNLGGNLLIMTATYPPYFRPFLNGSDNDVLPYKFEEISLNRVSSKIKNYSLKRHKIMIIDSSFEEEKDKITKEFKEILSNETKKDKNILIVCNTVGKSIRIHSYIEKEFPNEQCYLLHSRIIESKKQMVVDIVKGEIKNKKEGKKYNRIILVSTQIVEASVDIDFDTLLTEISPIDSQIQRWGRVYRNRFGKDGFPADYTEEEPNIIVFKVPDLITNRIYHRNTIEKTIEQLNDIDFLQVLDFLQERLLVEQTFERKIEDNGVQVKLREVYENKIRDVHKRLKFFSIEKRSEAQRLFRKIAGLSFILPDLMEREAADDTQESKLKKAFAEIIRNQENKELSWREIADKLNNFSYDDKKNWGWKLRALLNSYSITIPIYYIENQQTKGRYLLAHEFKGFYVWRIKEDKIDSVIKKGIDITEDIENVILDDEYFS